MNVLGWVKSPKLSVLFRLILAVIFLFSGWAKWIVPAYFAHAIEQFQLLPPTLIILATFILPWLEMFCGALLLIGLATEGAAALTAFLLGTFLVAILSAMARGIHGDCGCFGLFGKEEIGWILVLQDALLLAMALHILFFNRGRLTLERLPQHVKELLTHGR